MDKKKKKIKRKKIKRKKIKNIIVGISGVSGSFFSINFCTMLQKINYDPVVILTEAAKEVAELESGILLDSEFRRLGIKYYNNGDIGAPTASGSFETDGMVVYCSINTVSKIACGIADNLLIRTADVHLKERRKLVLIIRETPFHIGHLKTIQKVCEMGAIIMPLMFSFYSNEDLTIKGCFRQFHGRVLDQLGIQNDFVKRWGSK